MVSAEAMAGLAISVGTAMATAMVAVVKAMEPNWLQHDHAETLYLRRAPPLYLAELSAVVQAPHWRLGTQSYHSTWHYPDQSVHIWLLERPSVSRLQAR